MLYVGQKIGDAFCTTKKLQAMLYEATCAAYVHLLEMIAFYLTE